MEENDIGINFVEPGKISNIGDISYNQGDDKFYIKVGNTTYDEIVFHDTTSVRIQEIEKREKELAILKPHIEAHDKFPSLKEAYDHYKMIEKIVIGDKNDF